MNFICVQIAETANSKDCSGIVVGTHMFGHLMVSDYYQSYISLTGDIPYCAKYFVFEKQS